MICTNRNAQEHFEENMEQGKGTCDEYYVQYNAKDVAQYALSVGAASQSHSYRQEIRYVFEDHVNFSVIPTFAFALVFWAKRSGDGSVGNTSTIPQFPPPIMKSMGVIPQESLKSNVDVHQYPLIHTSLSMVWKKDLPVPTKEKNKVVVMIKGKFVSVHPKSVGTFVTTEYMIYEKRNDAVTDDSTHLGTARFTTLILGIPSAMVRPYNSSKYEPLASKFFSHPTTGSIRSLVDTRRMLLKVDYYVTPNTALMYRLASGDSNPMHVDPNLVPDIGHKKDQRHANQNEKLPFIHGLCTVGMVVRVILQLFQKRCHEEGTTVSVRYLDCRFKMPVFINDTIVIRAWAISTPTTRYQNDNHSTTSNETMDTSIGFDVAQKSTDSIAVDAGKMILSFHHSNRKQPNLRSLL